MRLRLINKASSRDKANIKAASEVEETNTSDQALDLKGRQRNHIEHLFVKYRGSLLHLLRSKLASEEDALELLQETYLRAMKQNDMQSKPSSYLFQIASNLVVDKIRKDSSHKQDQHVPFHDVDVYDEVQDPTEILFWQEGLEAVKRSLFELPPRSRQILLMRRLRGMSATEIAATIGVNKRTVERELISAVAHCKQYFQEES